MADALMDKGNQDFETGAYRKAVEQFIQAGKKALKDKASLAGIKIKTTSDYGIFVNKMILYREDGQFARNSQEFEKLSAGSDIISVTDNNLDNWSSMGLVEHIKKAMHDMIQTLQQVDGNALSAAEFKRIRKDINSGSSSGGSSHN